MREAPEGFGCSALKSADREGPVVSRFKLASLCVLFAVLGAVVFGIPAASYAAPTKGSGGWYWPVGTENFHGWDGYWAFRASNHSWHMAQDMPVPQGSPVYAIADGTIAESKADAGYGGVLVLWHTTGAGQKFLAVYGHVTRMAGMAKGTKVKAGQVIGHVNSADHCHFGIHPGNAYPPDNNPYRGHTYDGTQTYGWVDPVKFLKDHPAYLPYTAPTLPLVATISTASTPTVLGTAGSSVFWRCPDSTATVCTSSLPSGETTQLAENDALPSLDTTCYLACPTATGFTLYDKRPKLTASFSATTTPWGKAVGVSGVLANCAGKAFSGAAVVLQRASGSGWTPVAKTLTNPDGSYSMSYTPTRAYKLRVSFTPPSTYVATATAGVTVAPEPGLHAPRVVLPKTGDVITFLGTIDCRHKVGASTVKLELRVLNNGSWVDTATIGVRNTNRGKAATRYTGRTTLSDGTWRVRASMPADSHHAAQITRWVTFTVK